MSIVDNIMFDAFLERIATALETEVKQNNEMLGLARLNMELSARSVNQMREWIDYQKDRDARKDEAAQ